LTTCAHHGAFHHIIGLVARQGLPRLLCDTHPRDALYVPPFFFLLTCSLAPRAHILPFCFHISAITNNNPSNTGVDLVPLYPQSLWVPSSSPLHFLHDLRAYYLTTYADQFFVPPPAVVPPFFKFFTLLELVFHLPVSVWAVRALSGAGSRGTTGPAELLLLAYGLETVLTTATCMYEAYSWDAALVTREQRVMLLGVLYGSYLAIGEFCSDRFRASLLSHLGLESTALDCVSIRKPCPGHF